MVLVAFVGALAVPLESSASSTPRQLAHLSGSVGSINCSNLTGQLTFSPALTKSAKKVTVTIHATSPQCAPSDATSLTTSNSLSSTQSYPSLSCAALSGSTASFSMKSAWSPAPSASSSLSFSGFSVSSGPTGGAAMSFPASGAPASVSGPYAGSNGGSLSRMYFELSSTRAALTSACNASSGLKSLSIVSGLVALGSSAPVFTSSSTASFTEGAYATFPIAATTSVKAKMTWSGALPAGLVFEPSSDGSAATLDGTPLVGTAGNYPISVRVLDEDGLSATLSLSISVAAIDHSLPQVTSIVNNDGTSANSGAPGDDVTITGLNMSSVSAVQFGDVSATVKSTTATTVLATVPALGSGAYAVTVSSAAGPSPASLDGRFVVVTVPLQPPVPTVFAEGLGVHVSWSGSPVADAVTSYRVSLAPPSGYVASDTSCASAIVVSSIAPSVRSVDVPTSASCVGVPYQATLYALNASGTSVGSDLSDTVTAQSAQAPTGAVITHVSAGNKSLTVFWNEPPWNGGAALSAYDLAVTTGKATKHFSALAGRNNLTVNGLTNGVTYTLSLTARNAMGSANPSVATGVPTLAAVPGAPSSLLVRPSGTSTGISVSWSPPTYVVGTIGGYVVHVQQVALPGTLCRASVTHTLAANWKVGAKLQLVVPKCAAGFTTVSVNGATYDSTASTSASSVVLASAPSAGTAPPAIVAGGSVSFDTQVSIGSPTTLMLSASTTSTTVSHLLASACYRVSVAAKNSAGVGPVINSDAPVTPTVSLATGTVVLSAGASDAISYVARDPSRLESSYVWASAPSQLASVKPGTTVVVPASVVGGQATLVMVQSVSLDHAGEFVLSTMPADMTDAYQTFTFSYTGAPSGNFGVHSTPSRHSHVSLNINISGGGNSASGTVAVNPWVTISGSHWCTATWLGICYHWGVSATLSAGVSASENLTLHLTGSHSFDIFTCDDTDGCLSDIYFWIGPVPVEISPSIGISLDLNGDVTIASNASASWNGWMNYSSSGGFSHGSGHSFTATNGQNNINGTADASLNLTFQMCAYWNVLCGHVTGTASVDAVFNSAVVAPANYLTLTCGFSVSAGWEVHIFGWNPSGQATLISWSTQCYHVVAAVAPKILSIAPVALGGYPANTVPLGNNVVTLSASRNDLVTPTLTWSLLNPVSGVGCADSITNLAHLTTGCVGGNRSLIVRAVDSSTNPPLVTTRTITVQSGYVFDPPPAPFISQYAMGFSPMRYVTIYLTAPTNTGGYPMAWYYVHFSCPVFTYQGYGPQGEWAGFSNPVTTLSVQTIGYQSCTLVEWPINSNGAWGPPTTVNVVI